MLALVAGTGDLPPLLMRRLTAQGVEPVVCEMAGFASTIEGDHHRIPFRIETLGTFLATLKSCGVTQVCMAGAMQRPKVDPTAIDATTMPLVPRLMAAMAKGDDGTLREVIALFEEQGFEVVGASDLAPELLPDAGCPTKAQPDDLSTVIAAAREALVEMGQADLGQAVLVRDGAVIAREDIRGTDALLGDYCAPVPSCDGSGDPVTAAIDAVGDLIGSAADWLSGDDAPKAVPIGAGAILYKAPKPEQELRVDMPVIGPRTAMKAAEAGLRGIVVEHGRVMVLDLPQVVAILDAQGMFLQVVR
ncbi:MAG: UDP-2,3-diacylglucosamine diphosphatase LpxI [Octadecabacter sp.]|nr:UDP-2,3-diacylglucosamine diphosphatase LpxI [Octadecabacter sp.]